MKANTITTNIIKLLTTSTKVIAIVFSMAWVVFKFLAEGHNRHVERIRTGWDD